jgi:hypothetical protein
VNFTKVVAAVGITGALAAGALGVGPAVGNAAPLPGIGPLPAQPPPPGYWHHPEWGPGWNDGYPQPGWVPPEGWIPPQGWAPPPGWAPPAWYHIPCGGPLWNLFHPLHCW